MKTTNVKIKNLLAIMGLAIALGGCTSAGKPFAYTESYEIPPGPGLLSGDEGGYTIRLGGNKGDGQIAQRQHAERPASPPPVGHGRMVEAVTQQ
jgi:hypothetical protein